MTGLLNGIETLEWLGGFNVPNRSWNMTGLLNGIETRYFAAPLNFYICWNMTGLLNGIETLTAGATITKFLLLEYDRTFERDWN